MAAPVFLHFMDEFLKRQDESDYRRLMEEAQAEARRLGIEYVAPERPGPIDFTPPDGVDPVWVDRNTGRLAEPGAENVIHEYFVRGTEPSATQGEEETSTYLESPDL